jgi:hypothetical protein
MYWYIGYGFTNQTEQVFVILLHTSLYPVDTSIRRLDNSINILSHSEIMLMLVNLIKHTSYNVVYSHYYQ